MISIKECPPIIIQNVRLKSAGRAGARARSLISLFCPAFTRASFVIYEMKTATGIFECSGYLGQLKRRPGNRRPIGLNLLSCCAITHNHWRCYFVLINEKYQHRGGDAPESMGSGNRLALPRAVTTCFPLPNVCAGSVSGCARQHWPCHAGLLLFVCYCCRRSLPLNRISQ